MDKNKFEVSREQQGEVGIVSLSGRIDAHNAPDLLAMLEGMIENGNIKIVIDMNSVTFISSFGLGVLSSSLKEVKEKDGDIKLSSLHPDIMLPLEVTGLLPRFSVFGTISDAVSAFADK